MKSSPLPMGNIKMNGKKHKLLSCGCCDCVDFRDKYNMQLMKKDIESYNTLDTKEEIGNVGQW